MKVIEILDKYIEGDITEGNKLLLKCAMELHDDPKANVHRLLLDFSEQDLDFDILEAPSNMDIAKEKMEQTTAKAEKYIYALYLLKYQNPITTKFVDIVLSRIEVR